MLCRWWFALQGIVEGNRVRGPIQFPNQIGRGAGRHYRTLVTINKFRFHGRRDAARGYDLHFTFGVRRCERRRRQLAPGLADRRALGGEGVEGELEASDEGEEAGGLAPGDLVGHASLRGLCVRFVRRRRGRSGQQALLGCKRSAFFLSSAHGWRCYGTRFGNSGWAPASLLWEKAARKHACFRFTTPSWGPGRNGSLFRIKTSVLASVTIAPRQARVCWLVRGMGAMQTAVVALALGKNSLPTAFEVSLRFGGRSAEIMALLRSLLFAVRWPLPAPAGQRELQRGTPTRLRAAVATQTAQHLTGEHLFDIGRHPKTQRLRRTPPLPSKRPPPARRRRAPLP